MTKGYYLHSLPPSSTPEALLSYGVQKKILAQCKALNHFLNIEEKILYQEDTTTFFHKIISRLPFTATSEKWKMDESYKNIDFIYFRKNIIDYSIVNFFREIKKKNTSCKIVLEIPTYPYDQEEFKKLKDLPYKLKDRINRKRLNKYVDRITTFTSSCDQIFGIKTINIMNGIDFGAVPISKSISCGKTINIVIMSLFSHWHGFDRLIEGLNNFRDNSDYEIRLHFIGEGVAVPSYKTLVDKYQLENNVIFYGALHGDQLNEVFDKCDLACDSLGLHRLNLEFSSTLKSREYCARGLPLLCSSKIDFICNDFRYFMKLPSNDNPIEFSDIVKFYEAIYESGDSTVIRQEIREYGKNKIDMINTIQDIVQYLKEDNHKHN